MGLIQAASAFAVYLICTSALILRSAKFPLIQLTFLAFRHFLPSLESLSTIRVLSDWFLDKTYNGSDAEIPIPLR